jgi:D-glycero-D-manno-heptose 1,7-bisphosphate phosphatase
MHARLKELIPEIERIEVSTEPSDEGEPRRRKPRPGMLLDASEALHLDLARSWMVGDRWKDIDCGQRAGVKTIFLDYSYEEKLREAPDFRSHSLREATDIILSQTAAARP